MSSGVKSNWLTILIIMSGLFIHSFVLPIAGSNIRFYLLIPFLAIISISLKKSFPINKNLLILIPVWLYWFAQMPIIYLDNSSLFLEHLFTLGIISLFVVILNFTFSLYINKLNALNVYKAILLIFSLGLFLYLFVLATETTVHLRSLTLSKYNKIDYLNTLRNIVMMDAGNLPRFAGFHISPNFWAGFTIFALYLIIYTKNISNIKGWYYKASLVVVFTSLILTFSRGSYIALLLGYFIFLLFKLFELKFSINKNKFIKNTILIIVSFSIIGFLMINDNKFSRITEKKISPKVMLKDARFRIWDAHLEHIKDHVILGEGMQISNEVFVKNLNPPRKAGSHNTFLNLLNNMGILGLVVFSSVMLLISALLLRKHIKYYKQTPIFILGISMLTTLFYYSIFEHALTSLFFWGIIIMAIFITSYKPQTIKN